MTTQQIEAMKQALEALGLVNIEFVCNGAHHAKKDRHGLDEDCPVTMRYRKAITAIKEALAQPEQEPVAWPCLIAEADFSQDTVTLTMQCQDYKVSAGKHWLSTTPPQRKPLTDEEIDKLLGPFPRYADEWSMTDFIRFARAIEAAHGIKENT